MSHLIIAQSITTSAATSATFTNTPVAGNMVIVAISKFASAPAAPTDNQTGNTYTQIGTTQQANASNDFLSLYYAKNINSSGTFTVSTTSTNCTISIFEIPGASTTAPLDQTTGTTGTSTTPSAGSITTTAASEYLFVAELDDNGAGAAATAGTGYTVEEHQDDSTTHERLQTEDQLNAAIGIYTGNMTINASSHWAAIIASFIGAGTDVQANPVAGAVSPCDGPVNEVAQNVSFATIQASAGNQGGLESSSADNVCGLLSSTTSNQYQALYRSIFNFNTSAIGSGATIVQAYFSIFFDNKFNGLGTPDFHICGATPASTAAVASSDFTNLGSTSYGSVTYANAIINRYTTIKLNASGLLGINKSGITSLGARTSWDINNSFTGVWASNTNSYFHGNYADNATNKPMLTVYYTTPAATNAGVLIASFTPSVAFVNLPRVEGY